MQKYTIYQKMTQSTRLRSWIYCTVLETQAKEWAHRLYMRTFSGSEYVYQYIFHPSNSLNIKHFNTLDAEWLEFIKNNRLHWRHPT